MFGCHLPGDRPDLRLRLCRVNARLQRPIMAIVFPQRFVSGLNGKGK